MVQQCANNDTATLIFCFEVSLCFAPFLLLSSCHRWYSSHCDLLWYSEVFSGIYCGIQWYSSPVLLWSTVVFRGHKERGLWVTGRLFWLLSASTPLRLIKRHVTPGREWMQNSNRKYTDDWKSSLHWLLIDGGEKVNAHIHHLLGTVLLSWLPNSTDFNRKNIKDIAGYSALYFSASFGVSGMVSPDSPMLVGKYRGRKYRGGKYRGGKYRVEVNDSSKHPGITLLGDHLDYCCWNVFVSEG